MSNKDKRLFLNNNAIESNGILHKKNILFEAMCKTLGNVTEACKLVGVSRTMFYDYYNNDAEFKQQIDDIKNITLDFVESKLLKKVNEEDITAIIFYLKTQGKKRGYIEKSEQEITIQPPVVIDWSESVQEAEEVKTIEIKEENKEESKE